LRQSFLQVGEQLIPVAVIGLADEERSVRMKSIDAINAITDALADSDIIIRTTLDTALINDPAEKVSRFQELKAEQKSLSPLMKVLRGNIKTIAALGLLPGRTVHTRVETLAILQDYALFRKRLSDQARKIEGSEDKKALLFPKELDPFPIDEQGAKPILVSLIAGLKDVEWRVRLECACAIEMIFLQPDMLELVRTADNGSLLGAILDLLPNESNVYVVLNLARVLSRIAPGQIERILPVVIALLAHTDIDVRIQSVAVIKNYGPDAQQAVPALAAMVVEGDADFRLAVIQAIEAVGRSARPALPAVAANLKHANPQVRTASARALGRFGGLADETLAALDAASDDSSSEVRLAISEAITRIRAGSR
jgi:HEAT repeat protein